MLDIFLCSIPEDGATAGGEGEHEIFLIAGEKIEGSFNRLLRDA